MKRIIKDYKSITQEQLQLLESQYPEGFDEDNIISFTTPKGEYIRALEVKTEDTVYLIKMSEKMLEKIDDFTDDDFEISDEVGEITEEFEGNEEVEEDDDDK